MSKLNAKSIEKTLAKKKTTLEELIPIIVAGMVICCIIAVVYFLTHSTQPISQIADNIPVVSNQVVNTLPTMVMTGRP